MWFSHWENNKRAPNKYSKLLCFILIVEKVQKWLERFEMKWLQKLGHVFGCLFYFLS